MADASAENALDPQAYTEVIERALAEDRVADDATVRAVVEGQDVPAARVRAELLAKEEGVIAGLPLLAPIFTRLDPDATIELLYEDGEIVGNGTTLAWVRCTPAALLRGERTALNLLQRLSGIATKTAAFVEATMATGAAIYDTRKTTPGLRHLEKYAVRCGGGENHRMDLADGAMIKENHLVAAYGTTGPDAIADAVKRCFASLDPNATLCVEVENQRELEAATEAAGDQVGRVVIMLDDFEIGDMRAAVRYVRGLTPPRPTLEITGGVKLGSIEALASTGVRRLSTGAITHSARALDLSLKIRGPA